jgi:hypothetical protein
MNLVQMPTIGNVGKKNKSKADIIGIHVCEQIFMYEQRVIRWHNNLTKQVPGHLHIPRVFDRNDN